MEPGQLIRDKASGNIARILLVDYADRTVKVGSIVSGYWLSFEDLEIVEGI